MIEEKNKGGGGLDLHFQAFLVGSCQSQHRKGQNLLLIAVPHEQRASQWN